MFLFLVSVLPAATAHVRTGLAFILFVWGHMQAVLLFRNWPRAAWAFCACMAILVAGTPCFAATAAGSGAVVSLGPLVPTLATLLSGIVTTAIGVLTRAILARLKVANAADLASKIDIAAQAAAGEAYRQAVLHGQDLTIPAGQNAALAIGANYVLSRVPDALRQLGITPDQVDGLVASRLGTLLAGDPTVAPGKKGVAFDLVPGATQPPLAAPAEAHAAA